MFLLLFLAILLLFACSGNSVPETRGEASDIIPSELNSPSNEEKLEQKLVPDSEQKTSYPISVAGFLTFIDDNGLAENDNQLSALSSVDILKKYDASGNAYYFATVIPDFFWCSILYVVDVDDNSISGITATPLGGLKTVFSYDVVTMSQGVFVAVYSSSHMGNGSLYLVPIEQPDTIMHEIPRAIDLHYESNTLTAVEHALSSSDDDGTLASSVYLGGRLEATYEDINQDGHTDIILEGVQKVYVSGEGNNQILRKEYYIRNVFLYDLENDSFVYSDEYGESILLYEYPLNP